MKDDWGLRAPLLQHGSARHEDPLPVHEVEGRESLLVMIVRGVRGSGPLAVPLRIEMGRTFEAHVDGGGLDLLALLGSIEGVPVLGPQVRRVEGAADGREKVVRGPRARLALSAQLVAVLVAVLVLVVVGVERDERPVVPVGSGGLAGDVAAVLPPLLVAQVRGLLEVHGRRTLVVAGALVPASAAGGPFDLLVDGIHHAALFLLLREGLPDPSAPHVDLHVGVVPGRGGPAPLVPAVVMMVGETEG